MQNTVGEKEKQIKGNLGQHNRNNFKEKKGDKNLDIGKQARSEQKRLTEIYKELVINTNCNPRGRNVMNDY